MKLFIVAFITSYFTILLEAMDPLSILSCLLREVLLVVNVRGSFYQLTTSGRDATQFNMVAFRDAFKCELFIIPGPRYRR